MTINNKSKKATFMPRPLLRIPAFIAGIITCLLLSSCENSQESGSSSIHTEENILELPQDSNKPKRPQVVLLPPL